MFALIDADNFFVSCERVFRPDLQNKPVVVLSSNDGCVVSRSREIKALGIKMGAPYFQIKNEVVAHKINCFSSNFDLYGDMSRRLMRIIGRESLGHFEPYSIDECFVNLSFLSRNQIVDFCHNLRQQIWQSLGLPVSIGIAPSKTLAKLAGEKAKKNNNHIFDLSNLQTKSAQQIFTDTPISDIWGIGYASASNLRGQRIYSVADYRALTADFLQKNLGVIGVKIWQELHGEAVLTQPPSQQKSIQVTRSFGNRITSKEELKTVLAYFIDRASHKLRKRNLEARFLSIQIRTSYFADPTQRYSAYEHLTLSEATNQNSALIKNAYQLLNKIFQPGYQYAKAGVSLSGLQPKDACQLELFCDQTHKEKINSVLAAVDKINAKKNLVQIGYLKSQTKHFATRSQNRSPSYTTKWQELRHVS